MKNCFALVNLITYETIYLFISLFVYSLFVSLKFTVSLQQKKMSIIARENLKERKKQIKKF